MTKSQKSKKPASPTGRSIKNKKYLVIVESPAKAKTLEKFLGADYMVRACGGHVRDLPAKRLGVDIDNNFEPTYTPIKGKTKILKELKAASKGTELVFLAPDPDREGEAIAWHLHNLLKGINVKRIEFNEITKDAVTEAVQNPRDIDMNRVNAQQARRILDRLVGYKLSPLLWKKVRKGLSAGRVQSVAVELICEREKAILAFVPQEYWSVTADLAKKSADNIFQAKLLTKDVIPNQEACDKILQEIANADYIVRQVKKKEQRRNPPPPFITSTLQQDAARKLGFSARKTMTIAQQLYEGVEIEGEGTVGLITYMRTDSVRIANEALGQVREYISQTFGKDFLPENPRLYKMKKSAQDAHEAIRPTSAVREPEKIKDSLTSEQYRLYSLVWNRFVACQMAPALLDMTSVDIGANEHTFRATGSIIKFKGFMTLYLESKDEPEKEEEGLLPELTEGESLDLKKIDPKQHFTEPPPRYTEASLIRELEEKGVGRPSTYAPILSTIEGRGYVDRERKTLKPTELGMLSTTF
ncbi:MAG: type I DNA topoisomerase [Candidatus Margulisiibacteriota bacterium]